MYSHTSALISFRTRHILYSSYLDEKKMFQYEALAWDLYLRELAQVTGPPHKRKCFITWYSSVSALVMSSGMNEWTSCYVQAILITIISFYSLSGFFADSEQLHLRNGTVAPAAINLRVEHHFLYMLSLFLLLDYRLWKRDFVQQLVPKYISY